MVLNVAATVLPGVPGGAGSAITAYRAADNVVDAANISKSGQKVIGIGNYIAPNGGNAKPHGGAKHNAAIDNYIDGLPKEAKNIRKNQVQVDINGTKTGQNRPDVQYDINEQHVNVEFDSKPHNGEKHQQTIQKNDPESKIILKSIE